MNKFFSLLTGLIIAAYTLSGAQEITSMNTKKDLVYVLQIVDSTMVVAMGPHRIKYWDLTNNTLTDSYHTGRDLTCMDISADGKFIATGDKDGTINIIRSVSNELSFNQEVSGYGAVTDITIDDHGSRIAVTFLAGYIAVFYPGSKEHWIFQGYKKAALSITFNETGSYVAAGGANGTIKIWDTRKKKLIVNIKAHKSLIRKLLWVKQDTKIISGGDDGDIAILQAKDFAGHPDEIKIKKIRGRGRITGLDYNEKTKGIISCTINGDILLHFHSGTYKYKFASALHDIIFVPNSGIYFKSAIGTNGEGIILLDSKLMSFTNN